MITLANNDITVKVELIKRYETPIPSLIYGYVQSLGSGLNECTSEEISRELWITETVQSKWIKQLVRDKILYIEHRGLHNKRYLGVV